MQTFYRLRPEWARIQPAFRIGELYPYLRNEKIEGWVVVQNGKRAQRINTRHFEKIDREEEEPAE